MLILTMYVYGWLNFFFFIMRTEHLIDKRVSEVFVQTNLLQR